MGMYKCKMCGGTLEITNSKSICECSHCGTKQTIPKFDDDKRINLYNRATHFRRNNDFDKAMSIYEQLLNDNPNDAESYWSIVLCRYGIEYVEDPSTHKRIPTVNRAQFTPVNFDEDYKSALKYADPVQREIYEAEATTIDRIQKGILEISNKEDPFDIFICYKEADSNGERTVDSTLAEDIYHRLSQTGRRIFFSRITLEDKVGSQYEPYIFSALNSARVMIALGTKPEYFNSAWVKNEWSRFLLLMNKDRKRILLPCYRDMEPYELPDELSTLQYYDMSKISFIQELIHIVSKVFSEGSITAQDQNNSTLENQTSVTNLIEYGYEALNDGDWDKANIFFEKALDEDAENAEAYFGKMMISIKIRNYDELNLSIEQLDDEFYYKKAIKFADDTLKEKFTSINNKIKENKLLKVKKEKEEEERIAREALLKHMKELDEVRRITHRFAGRIVHYDCKIILINSDKTVESCGFPKNTERKLSKWTDIVSAAISSEHCVGLRSDGTVLTAGKNHRGSCSGTKNWNSITAVAAGSKHTVGLKADGTVTAAGSNKYGQCNVSEWTNIAAIAACENNTIGLKSDGTVIAVGDNSYGQCNVSDWTQVKHIFLYPTYTVGLRNDGTVAVVGDNSNGICDVSDWTDIIDVDGGYNNLVGMKSDGTVVISGDDSYNQCDILDWTDIVAVASGRRHTVGLKSDLTLTVAGNSDGFYINTKQRLSDRENINFVLAGNDYTIVITETGEIVAGGNFSDIFNIKNMTLSV